MSIWILLISILFIFIILRSTHTILKRNQRVVIIRLGRFNRIAGPDWVQIVPFIERVIKIDLDEKVPGWEGMAEHQVRGKIQNQGGVF